MTRNSRVTLCRKQEIPPKTIGVIIERINIKIPYAIPRFHGKSKPAAKTIGYFNPNVPIFGAFINAYITANVPLFPVVISYSEPYKRIKGFSAFLFVTESYSETVPDAV